MLIDSGLYLPKTSFCSLTPPYKKETREFYKVAPFVEKMLMTDERISHDLAPDIGEKW